MQVLVRTFNSQAIDYIKENCQKLQINNKYFCISVAKCEVTDVDKFTGLITKELDSTPRSSSNFSCLVFHHANLLVLIIGSAGRDGFASVDLKEILTKVLSRQEYSFYLGIGDVCELNNIYESYDKALDLISIQESADSNQILLKLKNYINGHYNEDLNLKVLSKVCNMNPFYISQFFKDKVGKNYSDYLQEIRISKAKEFLLKSDLSISEVSEKVGFNDYRIFIKVFKKYCNITPKQFKKKLEEETCK